MCGIAGIVSFDGRQVVDETRLKRMRDVLTHRGPDGEGLWIGDGVGLAHRRLAIVDVAGGHQPMTGEDGSVWITYNGEIYNHADLRAPLVARGHRYRTRSDTETIVHLYEEEGAGCVERLSGMFAFALWDRARRRLLLARDRLGIKPLYYAIESDELLFASEIKAILAARAGGPTFDARVLPEFLASGFVAGEETFFRGIRKLLPGRTLVWSEHDGLAQRRYWTMPDPSTDCDGDLASVARDLRRSLTDAVARHLMSDVPLGVFLSGGIDSTAIAALAAPMVDERLRTFAVGVDEASSSELDDARMAARAIGAEHHDVVVGPDEFFAAVPNLVWHEDEPIAFPSSVLLNVVSRLAATQVKVVLTGEGADELFLGYNRYRVALWNHRLGRYWASAPAGARRIVRDGVLALPERFVRYARRTALVQSPDVRSLFIDAFAIFPEALQRELLADRLRGRDPHAAALAHFVDPTTVTAEAMSRADLETYLVELLMKQDQMSMAASIESRVPFLDDAVVAAALEMPSRLKLRGLRTKAVLREAVRDIVPRAILSRPKMGFPVPIGSWLRRRWSVIEDLVLGPRALARGLFEPATLGRLAREHRDGLRDHGHRLWLLLGLEVWQRTFLDREVPDSLVADGARRCA